MISRKVDLTLDFSFSSPQRTDIGMDDHFDGTIVSSENSNENREANQMMSLNDYVRRSFKERFFGSSDVHDAAPYLFGRNKKNICLRCGKEIRVPWMRTMGFCEECETEAGIEPEKIPWNMHLYKAGRSVRTTEIFDLK